MRKSQDAWQLGIAAAVATAVWAFFLAHVSSMVAVRENPPRPTALDVRLVELPPTPPRVSETPPAVRAAPARNEPPTHARQASPARNATPHVTATAPRAPAPSPVPSPVQTESPTATAKAPDTPPPSAPTASANPAPGPANQEARLLSQPLPDLPDDLREQGYQAVAVARFTIHPDGSFDLDLLKPTQNPRLNQILLATLRQWRFTPATENGHPVESRQDVRVHFNVN